VSAQGLTYPQKQFWLTLFPKLLRRTIAFSRISRKLLISLRVRLCSENAQPDRFPIASSI
jgi:hypothetical protein